MKTLYLVRHAKSSWKYPELDDFERPLNKRGNRDAPFMGQVLKKLNVAPTTIISSPALRAAVTARIIAYQIDYPLDQIQYTESAYEFDETALINVIRQVDNMIDSVMLVSHNPGLTQFANYIGDYPVGNIPTCGVFCVDLNIKSWEDVSEHCSKLKFFEFPKKHA